MRLVIDSNQLQNILLRDFLEHSRKNFAVLTDFVAMEAYKGETLIGIFKSMEIISSYPNQIIVLKGTSNLYGCSGRRKGLQKRLIDRNQTENFHGFIKDLKKARSGDKKTSDAVLEHGRYANEHFDEMIKYIENIKPAIESLGAEFSKEERQILRERKPPTLEMTDRIYNTVLDLVGHAIVDLPHIRRNPPIEELPNTYVFRVILSSYLMGICRVAEGGVNQIKPEKLRNDFVDMTLVAAGTYFDGVLSSDIRLKNMFEYVGAILSVVFRGEVPAFNRYVER